MKLTEAQKTLLKRALRNDGGVRVHGGYEDRTAQSLLRRDLIRTSIPGYGSDYFLTEAGRRALNTGGEVMSAREIIATSTHSHACDGGYSVVGGAAADAAISALTAAGYRILAPGEMDRETLEAAAKVAADRACDWLVGQPLETRRDAPPDIAAAIRALNHGE